MTTNKLFNILVIGGGLIISSNGHSQNALNPKTEVPTPLAVASCSPQDSNTCEKVHACSEDGELTTKFVVKKGIECCWNTSCSGDGL